ncbi:hypothetical protein C7818_1084 [Leuconostoc mesenteroides]|uniref:hypothetical protein n=1 Tax=Leuconostoc mesenteroides TaxID=1245 RepID=UPI0010CF6C91|nr:hypothetical protein [Leuconostoc mesenteroides]TDV91169.1 hypothetical protein C7818_1084 [Leuconostoc mesenteroides]
MVVTLPEPYKPRNDFERDYFEGKEAVPFHEKCLYVYALNNTDEADFMWMTYEELQKNATSFMWSKLEQEKSFVPVKHLARIWKRTA